MKTKVLPILKELKCITNTYISQLTSITKTIRETYEDEINFVKSDLITRIATEYSLDVSELKSKFLRKKKKNITENNDDNIDDNNSDSEYMPSLITSDNKQLLLYKTEYENDNYYIEMIDGGKVYDSKKNEVGIWLNGQMELNMNLIKQLKNL